jgi:two-component system response regulator NreC
MQDNHSSELTSREVEILKLIARGLSNADIAGKLFISIRTVESHKNHIMSKLNLKTPAELVLYAIRNKMVTMDE